MTRRLSLVVVALSLALASAATAAPFRGTYAVKAPGTPTPADLKVTSRGIARAATRIGKQINLPTPLVYSAELSKRYGVEIYLKLESSTEVGSFKIRGAMNKVLSLRPAVRKRGVVAASTGNHAQGVALAAATCGVDATIVMPEGASELKAEKTRRFGATVLMQGENYDRSVAVAQDLARTRRCTFISGYEDRKVIEGQGTIGWEILKQLPDADWVISALGGGGLMGGISSAGHDRAKHPLYVGVQSENNAPMFETLRRTPKAAEGLHVEIKKTIADGTMVTQKPSPKMVDLLRSRVDLVVKVRERSAERAVLELLDRTGYRIEGAGALTLAGLGQALKDLGRVASLKGVARPRKVVLVLSGGNIDQHKLDDLRARQDQP
jgi:threonine dehydratase